MQSIEDEFDQLWVVMEEEVSKEFVVKQFHHHHQSSYQDKEEPNCVACLYKYKKT